MDKGHARKIVKRLIQENAKGRSWRTIAREDFPMLGVDGKPIVKPGTLNRIANENGNYFPVEDEILIALGLKKSCVPKPPPAPIPPWLRDMKKKIAVMAKQTRKDIFIHDQTN